MGLLGDYLQGRRATKAQKKQQNFQEHMSNTAWQRGMADMRLAGLNPILAYKEGPASSPAGASASFASTGDTLGTAVQATRAATAVKTGGTTRTLHGASTAKMITAAGVDRAHEAKLAEEKGYVQAQTAQTAATARGIEFDNVGKAIDADIYGTARGRFSKELGMFTKHIPALFMGIGGIGRGAARRGKSKRGGINERKDMRNKRHGTGARNARTINDQLRGPKKNRKRMY